MPNDPQVQAILAMFAAMPAPDLATLRATDYRAGVAQMQLPPVNQAIARLENLELEGPAGALPVRLYHPQPGTALPAVVFFHGGGWVACSLDSHDNLCRRLAALAGCAVVSVDYRLAPEAVFPAALDDACAALRQVVARAGELGIDPKRLAVAGDSAGGNLAAACAQLARDPAHALPRLVHQLLFYPVLDSRRDTPSYTTYAEGYLLSSAMLGWFWDQYVPRAADRSDVRASPAHAVNLAGVAPATLLLAECDPLHDDGVRYAARLGDAGVPVTQRSWDGLFHGFASMTGMLPAADEALAVGAEALKKAFATAA